MFDQPHLSDDYHREGPDPRSPNSRSHGTQLGSLLAGGGGIVALRAFFELPIASLGFFSLTGAQLARSGLSRSGLLWIVPMAAVAAIGISAARCIYGSALKGAAPKGVEERLQGVTGRNGAVALLLIGSITASLLFVGFLDVSQYSSVLDSGFWLALLGMIAIAVGGYVEYGRASQRAAGPPAAGDKPRPSQSPRSSPSDPTK